jgi:lysophospholipase L1-like esterase
VVLLMVGANDLDGPAGPEIDVRALSSQYEALLDRIREQAPGALLVVATVTPADASYAAWDRMKHRNDRIRAFNEQVVKPAVARRVERGDSIVLADMFPALDPDTDLSDGVHPNLRGKQAINRVWAEALIAALQAPASSKAP